MWLAFLMICVIDPQVLVLKNGKKVKCDSYEIGQKQVKVTREGQSFVLPTPMVDWDKTESFKVMLAEKKQAEAEAARKAKLEKAKAKAKKRKQPSDYERMVQSVSHYQSPSDYVAFTDDDKRTVTHPNRWEPYKPRRKDKRTGLPVFQPDEKKVVDRLLSGKSVLLKVKWLERRDGKKTGRVPVVNVRIGKATFTLVIDNYDEYNILLGHESALAADVKVQKSYGRKGKLSDDCLSIEDMIYEFSDMYVDRDNSVPKGVDGIMGMYFLRRFGVGIVGKDLIIDKPNKY